MAQCQRKTKAGKQCRARVVRGTNFCNLHQSKTRAREMAAASTEARRKAAQRATEEARMLVSVPMSTEDLKSILARSLASLLNGKLNHTVARTAAVLGSTFLKAFEQTDVARKLEELRKALEEQGVSGRSGSSEGNNVRRPNDVEE